MPVGTRGLARGFYTSLPAIRLLPASGAVNSKRWDGSTGQAQHSLQPFSNQQRREVFPIGHTIDIRATHTEPITNDKKLASHHDVTLLGLSYLPPF